MKLNEFLNEARGSGSFDYRFWFWAKKGSQYGFGYARQNIKVDIEKLNAPAGEGSSEFEKMLHPTVRQAVDALNQIQKAKEVEQSDEEYEVVEKKIKANTKRIQGVADLFSSPIVIHWLTDDKPTLVTIPHYKDGDVTDSAGKQIKVLEIFRDPETREFVTHHIDWSKVNINDEKTGDTLNTIMSKFIQTVFESESKGSKRKVARSAGLEQMKDLKFKTGDVEVISFKSADYNLLPKDLIGSKKIIGKINDIKKNFQKLLQKARAAF